MISCERFDELHLLSLDAPLDDELRARFDEHLAVCHACVERLKGYVTTSEILRGLDAAEDRSEAPPLSERLVQRYLTAIRTAAEDEARRTG